MIKRLDDISETDILQLELPRAIPLIYDLDVTTFKPIKNKKREKDGTIIDVYNGVGVEVELLSGRYICDPTQLKNIAKRDQQQVYDLRYKSTLETAPYLGSNPIKEKQEKQIPQSSTHSTHTSPESVLPKIKKEVKEVKEIKETKVA